jgi:endonuclease YncB( thermonuclease family)
MSIIRNGTNSRKPISKARRVKIRPSSIDAPELGQACTRDGKPWYAGRHSGRWLTEFLDGKQVSCVLTGKRSYGRYIADCTVDGKSVQESIVRAGWAFDYRRFSKGRFAAAEAEAKAARRGVHAGQCEKPWVWRRKRR